MLFIKYPQLEEHARALHKSPATSCYASFTCPRVLVLPLTVCNMLHCHLQFMVSVGPETRLFALIVDAWINIKLPSTIIMLLSILLVLLMCRLYRTVIKECK